MLLSFTSNLKQLGSVRENLDEMQAEIQVLRAKNAGLYEKLEQLESDDYVEQIAREKLGLVMPGETRIVTVPPAEEITEEDEE